MEQVKKIVMKIEMGFPNILTATLSNLLHLTKIQVFSLKKWKNSRKRIMKLCILIDNKVHYGSWNFLSL